MALRYLLSVHSLIFVSNYSTGGQNDYFALLCSFKWLKTPRFVQLINLFTLSLWDIKNRKNDCDRV